MSTDDRHEFEMKYREFAEISFPKLGYKVDGLPETDSVLAGYVSQALSRVKRILLPESGILTKRILAEIRKVCDAHQDSPEAAELDMYVRKMNELEDALRAALR